MPNLNATMKLLSLSQVVARIVSKKLEEYIDQNNYVDYPYQAWQSLSRGNQLIDEVSKDPSMVNVRGQQMRFEMRKLLSNDTIPDQINALCASPVKKCTYRRVLMINMTKFGASETPNFPELCAAMTEKLFNCCQSYCPGHSMSKEGGRVLFNIIPIIKSIKESRVVFLDNNSFLKMVQELDMNTLEYLLTGSSVFYWEEDYQEEK